MRISRNVDCGTKMIDLFSLITIWIKDSVSNPKKYRKIYTVLLVKIGFRKCFVVVVFVILKSLVTRLS